MKKDNISAITKAKKYILLGMQAYDDGLPLKAEKLLAEAVIELDNLQKKESITNPKLLEMIEYCRELNNIATI